VDDNRHGDIDFETVNAIQDQLNDVLEQAGEDADVDTAAVNQEQEILVATAGDDSQINESVLNEELNSTLSGGFE